MKVEVKWVKYGCKISDLKGKKKNHIYILQIKKKKTHLEFFDSDLKQFISFIHLKILADISYLFYLVQIPLHAIKSHSKNVVPKNAAATTKHLFTHLFTLKQFLKTQIS